MRFKTTLLTLAMAVVVASYAAFAQDETETLRATERERLRSLVEADVERARRLHADDFQLVTPAGVVLSIAATGVVVMGIRKE